MGLIQNGHLDDIMDTVRKVKSVVVVALAAGVLIFSAGAVAAEIPGSGSISAQPGSGGAVKNDCGLHALGWMMQQDGMSDAAAEVLKLRPTSANGLSISDMIRLAGDHAYDLRAVQVPTVDLAEVPLPAIVHLKAPPGSATGHFSILTAVTSNRIELVEPKSEDLRHIPRSLSGRYLSGRVLITRDFEQFSARRLSIEEASRTYGGDDPYVALPRSSGTAGNPSSGASNPSGYTAGGGNGGVPNGPCGTPKWAVNMINFNLYMEDVPLWYRPAIGPGVHIWLSYNAQAGHDGNEIFGRRWRLYYESHVIDDGASVTVLMPDGRADTYTWNDTDQKFDPPVLVYNRLVRIAANHFEVVLPDDSAFVYQQPYTSPANNVTSMSAIRDPFGNQVTLQHFLDGSLYRIQSITDALGRATTLTYTAGKVTRIDDPFGRSATFTYDGGSDTLQSITDMGGFATQLRYAGGSSSQDRAYLIEEMWQNSDEKTFFHIEPADHYTNLPNPYTGYPTPDTIDPNRYMAESYRITVTNPDGNKAEYHYNGTDGYGWYVSPRDYMEYVDSTHNNANDYVPKTIYRYADVAGTSRAQIASIDYPSGGRRAFTYYQTPQAIAGQVSSVYDALDHVTTYTYNTMGRVTSMTPPIGAATTYVYDSANQVDLIEVQRPGVGRTVMTYNGRHQATDVKVYDDQDAVIRHTGPTSYHPDGRIASTTTYPEGSAVTSSYSYYPAGHATSPYALRQVTRGGDLLAEYSYDNVGRVDTFLNASGVVFDYDYNDLNRLTRITYPDDGRSQTYAYEGCCPDLVTSITDRANRTTSYQYDKMRRLVQITNPEGGRLQYAYDHNGNTATQIDHNGNRTEFHYNNDNRLVGKTFADGKAESYILNDEGRITQRTDARGVRTRYVYDAVGNLLLAWYSDSTPSVRYQYDAYFRLTQMIDGTGTTIFSHYADDRLASVDGPWANDTITYVYDLNGLRQSLNVSNGQNVAYDYDHHARLTALQNNAGTFTYGYTPSSADPLVQTLTRPNTSQTVYQYNDPLKRLTRVTNQTGSAALVNQFDYRYDDSAHPDQRSRESIESGLPITSFQTGLKTHDYNEVNQLMASTNPARSFAYDDAGNMTQGYTPDGQMFTALYDGENRLRQIEYMGGGALNKIECLYSGKGFLAVLRIYQDGLQVDEIRILRDGMLALQERNGSDAVLREFTWGFDIGGGIGGLLDLNQGGSHYSYLYDGKGNVTALIDAAQGVAASYAYDAFGKLMQQSGSLDQPYMFSTKRYMAGVGLNYYGYRYYASAIGKWLTRDPIGEAGGLNLYGFVQNNPVKYIDLFGLKPNSAAMYTGLRNEINRTKTWWRIKRTERIWAGKKVSRPSSMASTVAKSYGRYAKFVRSAASLNPRASVGLSQVLWLEPNDAYHLTRGLRIIFEEGGRSTIRLQLEMAHSILSRDPC
jgi:RHS repeat-associated protein